ncbi:fidgetin-like protein 1 [Anopheles nili]|uniref:fidgetin-like protein 1 n=1 Tax=Anopheles nili TaxID=185578 RepID=UPI00237B0569|nr:fidgetin-like protein 1 [Anopheles nili]
MGDSTPTTEDIYKCLREQENIQKHKDPNDAANELRNLNYQLYAESLHMGDERLTAHILDNGLRKYQALMINPERVNNYIDDVLDILPEIAEDDFVLTESALDNASCYLDIAKNACQGQFENCSANEISLETLSKIITKPKRFDVQQSVQLQGPSQCSTDISRRVFANGSNSSFTPKIPITKPAMKPSALMPAATQDYPSKAVSREPAGFRTAKDELQIQNLKKYGTSNPSGKAPLFAYNRKTLGGRRTLGSKFVCPVRSDSDDRPVQRHTDTRYAQSRGRDYENNDNEDNQEEELDERLKNIDPKMIELIRSEIMDRFQPLTWDDIAGLEYAKTTIQEAVVWPILRPDIFSGLRKPPRGILLFGPPGTGKTLIGKCIASQSKSTFFSISASSLTSKWIGDGEKMVRALFAVAAVHQPAVVFIDEIDSLLCQRSDTEHESSRRLKTEFLVQLDGAATAEDERILIVGATNRPQELDEAARRRLVKRLYIPLPERAARIQILTRLLEQERNSLEKEEIARIGDATEGFSGADMKVLCHEASMGPIRSIPFDQLGNIAKEHVRPICNDDFQLALNKVKASVSPNDLEQYSIWNRTYGTGAT